MFLIWFSLLYFTWVAVDLDNRLLQYLWGDVASEVIETFFFLIIYFEIRNLEGMRPYARPYALDDFSQFQSIMLGFSSKLSWLKS